MHPAKKRCGFTLVELAIIIVVLAILAVSAVPIYSSLTDDAKASAEDGVVGNIRSGLSLYRSNSAKDGGVPSYPGKLDDVPNNTDASDSTPLFVFILKGGVTDGWNKKNDNQYIGPTGTTYEYKKNEGTFKEK